jgi:hypothetical protein
MQLFQPFLGEFGVMLSVRLSSFMGASVAHGDNCNTDLYHDCFRQGLKLYRFVSQCLSDAKRYISDRRADRYKGVMETQPHVLVVDGDREIRALVGD